MPRTSGPPELDLAVTVARRYFLDGRNKVEIAAELGISRFKVSRLLDLARQSGLVRIEVRDAPPDPDALGKQVATRYGLTDCVVVSRAMAASGAVAVGQAGGALLQRRIGPDDVLGLPWARAVHHAIAALDKLPPVPVVQLCGSLVMPGEGTSVDVARRAAELAGSEALVFHAPLVMPTAAGALAVRSQRDVERAMAAASRVTIALCSIGAWIPGGSTVHDQLEQDDVDVMARAGVVGETMGVCFTADGDPVDTEVSARVTTLSGDQLRAIPTILAMARGAERAPATRAALAGGLIDSLVIDAELAEALLG